ncbi:MAG: sigma-70 family RNA polymerase sigma factor [Lentisphaeraceae bacterium]|nr:sigma-70 family RNA polymerase sigma factor [Lentisphaeraceae bacterium]
MRDLRFIYDCHIIGLMDINSTRMTLIQRVKNRLDDKSWEEFARWYEPYIKAIAYKTGVPLPHIDDLCQDILLRVWKSIENFEYNPEKCKFRTWLTTVSRNQIYTFFGREKKKQNDVEVNEEILGPEEAELDEIIEKEWQTYIVKLAIEKVRESFSDKVVDIYLAFQNGQTVDAIAQKYEVSESSVYVYNKRVKAVVTREIVLLVNDLE